VADSGVLKSTDGGATWSPVNVGVAEGSVRVVAIDPVNTSTIYTGTGSGVFKSTDGGASWTLVNPSPAGDSVVELAIDPVDTNTIYAVEECSYVDESCESSDVLKSTDGGVTWRAITELSNRLIRNLVIVASDPNVLYVTGPTGLLFRSGDAGATWSPFSDGLDHQYINSLAIDPTGTSFHAGTDAGVFDYQYATPRITSASVARKNLLVGGENFDLGAVILLNGQEQNTTNDAANPQTGLVGKKADKKIRPGDRLQVRNANGTLSEEFTFTGS